MLARGIGLVILLWCSVIAGVGYARRDAPPAANATAESAGPDISLVKAPEQQPVVQPQAALRPQPEPSIRIILPSPYEPR